MKKYSLLIIYLLVSTLLLSACTTTSSSNTIKYERKFGKYFEQEKNIGGTIDLSEGPKLKYDAKLGPNDLNFDFKIINPY